MYNIMCRRMFKCSLMAATKLSTTSPQTPLKLFSRLILQVGEGRVRELERGGERGVTSNVTSIPPVKSKHMELVPAKMSEEEFWLQFFQSQLFHRDSLPKTNSRKNILSDILTKEQRCKYILICYPRDCVKWYPLTFSCGREDQDEWEISKAQCYRNQSRNVRRIGKRIDSHTLLYTVE